MQDARYRTLDSGRLLMLTGFIACGLLSVLGRLVYLQILQASALSKKAMELRRKEVPLLALRGAILDRKGRVLACSTWAGTVVTAPSKVPDPAFFARWLAPYLQQEPRLLAQKLGDRSDQYVRLAKEVSWDRIERLRQAYVQQANASKEFRKRVGPLWFEPSLKREYPNGRLAAQTLGLVKVETDAKTSLSVQPLEGLEKSQNEQLRGRDGFILGEVTQSGWIIPETRIAKEEPVPGKDVQTTLDASIQSAVENALDQVCRKHQPRSAVALVLDPKTGEILAMANRPTFDPNNRKTLTNRADALTNRAIALRYEPGSTLKPIMIAAALQEGVINPQSRCYCGGSLKIGRRRMRCDLHGGFRRGHGSRTPAGILTVSCNVGAAQIALKLGPERLYEYVSRFGVLDRTGVELPGEVLGDLAPPDRWDAPQLRTANIGFGQGIAMTPLGLVAAYGVLANNGIWVQPHLIKTQKPVATRQVVDPAIARLVRYWLVNTIEEGTGKEARIDGYLLAGKTGTAQKVNPKGRGYMPGKYLASFIGFVPADEPRAVVLVMVEEPKNGYYGGVVAAPVFREIAQYLLWYWRIPKQDTLTKGTTRGSRGV